MATGNPNHPVSREMEQQWHKIVAIMMLELGIDKFVIDADVLKRFERNCEGGGVVANALPDRLEIFYVNREEAERLARKEGGLPV